MRACHVRDENLCVLDQESTGIFSVRVGEPLILERESLFTSSLRIPKRNHFAMSPMEKEDMR